MKRSGPLKRLTPLKRTGYLPRVSKKRAKLMREVGPERAEFVKDIGHCQNIDPINGDHFGPLNVHEITNGPNRERALKVRAACLVLCQGCNCVDFTDDMIWPLERQLALKLVTDPEHFDLDAINKLLAPKGCKKPPQRVTLVDVAEHLTLFGS